MLNNRNFNARLSLLTDFPMDLYSSKISEKSYVSGIFLAAGAIERGKVFFISLDFGYSMISILSTFWNSAKFTS